MSILTWIIFGLIVGIVTNILDPRPSAGGFIGTITLGILGAVLGGLLGDLIFGTGAGGFNTSSFIVAVAGSLILLVLSRAFRET